MESMQSSCSEHMESPQCATVNKLHPITTWFMQWEQHRENGAMRPSWHKRCPKDGNAKGSSCQIQPCEHSMLFQHL